MKFVIENNSEINQLAHWLEQIRLIPAFKESFVNFTQSKWKIDVESDIPLLIRILKKILSISNPKKIELAIDTQDTPVVVNPSYKSCKPKKFNILVRKSRAGLPKKKKSS
ncbi:MAG: hypothetical protein A2908_04145 [Candidatus Staskawiczbacteria bacterium RIFCSPLOWO2_01_FULL_38_12b]|uniref:Uncharacterized protein n=1 Tax=Candidatus Staskawiczbacteria bacterium RIFCSPLOWO2_01_FULL_38_12b TaxID=1802214 RepID=A0A1G2IF98_9BACT|nr:MAG: hypothetical protein A2908_04145 [Candidatus Staskawiczbacteria bacterium RIFCSPLOWO2_01_FULL_38_12b]